MIPFCDVIPTRTRPHATRVAIVLLILAGFVAGPGLLYLATHVLLLGLFGPALEDRLGPVRWVALLAGGHVAGAGAALWAAPDANAPMAGATGAVAGLAAAYLLAFRDSQILVLLPIPVWLDVVEVPAVFFTGAWLMAQLLTAPGSLLDAGGLFGGVFGTIGAGAAAGAALKAVLWRAERENPAWWSPVADAGVRR